jgi:hypothetical protein
MSQTRVVLISGIFFLFVRSPLLPQVAHCHSRSVPTASSMACSVQKVPKIFISTRLKRVDFEIIESGTQPKDVNGEMQMKLVCQLVS